MQLRLRSNSVPSPIPSELSDGGNSRMRVGKIFLVKSYSGSALAWCGVSRFSDGTRTTHFLAAARGGSEDNSKH